MNEISYLGNELYIVNNELYIVNSIIVYNIQRYILLKM